MLNFFKKLSIIHLALFTLFALFLTGCANAGKSQKVSSGDAVTLDGSKSSPDFKGQITYYKWKQINGTKVTLSKDKSIYPTFVAPAIKTKEKLLFSLVTIESGGQVSPWKSLAIVDITVIPSTISNHAPNALAQGDRTNIKPGQSIIFNAENSTDSDGHIISYTWKDQNNTILSSEVQFTHTFTTVGTHSITLTVTDDDEATDTDTLQVTVYELQKPTAKITAKPTSIVVDEKVSFNANSSTDTDGKIVSYLWKEGNDVLSTESSFVQIFTTLGEHTISLIVKDDDDLEDTTNLIITVNNPLDIVKPVITLLGDTTVHIVVGDSYTDVGATASDNIDGDITVNIEMNNTVNTNKLGTYTVTYNVSDATGNKANEVTRTVVVKKELPLLVIRVSFKDHQIQGNITQWHDKIFGTSQGKLNHYYNEISYGKLQFKEALENEGTTNDGIIDVTLPFDRGDYSSSTRDFRETANATLLFINNQIDFSIYDTDNNKLISTDELQILFIVAGIDGSSFGGRNSTNVSAHTQSLVNGVMLDNVSVANYNNDAINQRGKGGKYIAVGELHDDSNGIHEATIGQIAHEFGHGIFNFPDLYDTTQTSNGIGYFGLMADGAWGYVRNVDSYLGQTPSHMTGYTKMKAGFVKPIIIHANKQTLPVTASISNEYTLYKINTKVKGEYFLIENRAPFGYDKGLSGPLGLNDFKGGLLITHVDENVNTGNTVVTHKLIDVEEANNPVLDDKTSRGHLNNLYFSGNATEFSSTTTPNSKQYNGQDSGIRIFNISQAGEVMTLDIEINQ